VDTNDRVIIEWKRSKTTILKINLLKCYDIKEDYSCLQNYSSENILSVFRLFFIDKTSFKYNINTLRICLTLGHYYVFENTNSLPFCI